MACAWVEAEKGCAWVPSEKGSQDSRIAAKFTLDYSHQGSYQKKVPIRWVKDGLVRMVKL